MFLVDECRDGEGRALQQGEGGGGHGIQIKLRDLTGPTGSLRHDVLRVRGRERGGVDCAQLFWDQLQQNGNREILGEQGGSLCVLERSETTAQ